jgi:prefoldin subunit 5
MATDKEIAVMQMRMDEIDKKLDKMDQKLDMLTEHLLEIRLEKKIKLINENDDRINDLEKELARLESCKRK